MGGGVLCVLVVGGLVDGSIEAIASSACRDD